MLPDAFRDLHEVFAEVPEDSRVLSERRLWFLIASKPGSSSPERPGLDSITSQP